MEIEEGIVQSAREIPNLLSRVLKASKNPNDLLRKIKRRSLTYIYSRIPYEPDYILDKEWDTLILLDACRFDLFSDYIKNSENLTKILSPGTCTRDWIVENFSGKQLKDVIYISAHPIGSYIRFKKYIGYNPFYKIIEIWKNGWNEQLGTVHPSMVNKRTLETISKYPDKRYIIHYVQPHHPFIGNIKITESEEKVWDLLRKGLVDKDIAWRAYASNLELVMSHVNKLLPNLKGKTCITSDHGNVFGKFGVFYAHPSKIYLPELIEVPWYEVENNHSSN